MLVNCNFRKEKNNIQFIIDEEDQDLLKDRTWKTRPRKHTTYIYSTNGNKKVHLHRHIMGLGDFKDDRRVVNHINGNGLDNRRCNLEICSNMYNTQSFRCPNKSVGSVCWIPSKGRWRYRIVINKKTYAKLFKTKEEALEYKETKRNELIIGID